MYKLTFFFFLNYSIKYLGVFLPLILVLSKNALSCCYQYNMISFCRILKYTLAVLGCRKDSKRLKKVSSGYFLRWDPLDFTLRVWAQPLRNGPEK